MLYPYKIIDSKMSSRDQFEQTEGYQPTHALFYLKKGKFAIEINGCTEEIVEGECILLPDYIFFRRNVLNPIEFIYVKFAQNPKCPYTFPLPFGKVPLQNKTRILANILSMEKYIERDDALSAGYREILLMDILFHLFFEQSRPDTLSEKTTSNDPFVSKATEYMIAHIDQKLLIDDICREVGTNATTLNFKFRREFNLSIGQFILNERIKRAKKLLIGTTYSISEIASRCGFENVYYFSNFFKKHTGTFPSKYRTENIYIT